MIKSIQQFQTEGVKKLEKVFVDYSVDMTRFAEMVYGIRNGVLRENGRNELLETRYFGGVYIYNPLTEKETYDLIAKALYIVPKYYIQLSTEF